LYQRLRDDPLAIDREIDRIGALICPAETADTDPCLLDQHKHMDLTEAMFKVFGRGKYVDTVESNRPRYNKNKAPMETYRKATYELFGDALWDKWYETVKKQNPKKARYYVRKVMLKSSDPQIRGQGQRLAQLHHPGWHNRVRRFFQNMWLRMKTYFQRKK
jgi:hypothetical protein